MPGDEKNSTGPLDERPATESGSRADGPNAGGPNAVELSQGGSRQTTGSTEQALNENRPDQDELPEFEPLTPELVEEEAIRGDFMLRWAVIFLALLFGFSKLTDTRTLVHIRSGDQMRANGFLPPRVDVFSFSAEGQPSSNVSWLFDHVISGVWALGGANGLSVFKAVVAAVIAWVLVHISVAGLPTWWSSICAAFAVVACSADFVAMTDLMTLLGMVLLLKQLHLHREGLSTGLTWKLPLLIAVWCNLDPRAWLGALTVVLYAIGSSLRRKTGEMDRADSPDGAGVGESVPAAKGLGMAAVACVLALLVNPFPLNSLLSPTTIYSVEYPAMQDQRPLGTALARISFDGRVDYFPLLSPDVFLLFDHTQIAGLAMILMAVVVLIMAARPADRGFALVLAGLTLLAVMATHELPAAALTAAVVAGTTAQRWYRRNYPQQYTTDTGELLFSRGGRAVTVFAMAFLGFGVVAGRLPGNTPVGLGFDKELQTTIDTLGTQLADADPTARFLHTRIDQGDILIWHGRRSMIDSRLVPFGRPSNSESVIARHKVILSNLLQRPPEAASDEDRKRQADEKTAALGYLADFGITHAMPRLAPPGLPDYRSVEALAGTPDWLLTSLGPSAAILEKVTPDLSAEDRSKKLPPFGKMAFQEVKPASLARPDFAREPSFYERHVYRERPSRDQYQRLAEHYLWLSRVPLQSMEQALASLSMTTMCIRNLNQSLFLNPQNSEAYRSLGVAYQHLGDLEILISGQPGQSTRQQLRYLQCVMALRQALKGNPDDPLIWEVLFQQYQMQQKKDLVSECLEHWLPLQENRLDDVEVEAAVREMYDLQRQLKDEMAAEEKRLTEFLKQQDEKQPPAEPAERAAQLLNVAGSLVQLGFDRRALKLLNDRQDLVQQNPVARLLRGRLLLECGELEDGFAVINQVGAIAREQPTAFAGTGWHFPAAVSQLCLADYTAAVDYWKSQLEEVELAREAPEPNRNLLLTMPLAAEATLLPGAVVPQWPMGHLGALQIPAQGIAHARAEVRFLIALSHIEEGDTQAARLILQSILSECGQTPYRTLVAFYLALIDNSAGPFIQQNTLDDWEDFEFTSITGGAAPVAPAAPAAAPAVEGGAPAAPATSGAATPSASPTGGAAATDATTPGAATPGAAATKDSTP